MAEAVTSALTAMGVNPSREAIVRARRLTRVANCAFSEGIAQALDAPDGSYDVLVSSPGGPITYRILGAPRRYARWCVLPGGRVARRGFGRRSGS